MLEYHLTFQSIPQNVDAFGTLRFLEAIRLNDLSGKN